MALVILLNKADKMKHMSEGVGDVQRYSITELRQHKNNKATEIFCCITVHNNCI